MRLTARKRRALASRDESDFAIPEKAPGPGSYPLPDLEHGQKALQLDHNAPPDERKRIERKVHQKFPSIGKK